MSDIFEKYVKLIIPERESEERKKFYELKHMYDEHVRMLNMDTDDPELIERREFFSDHRHLSGAEIAAAEIEYERYVAGYICDMNKIREHVNFKKKMIEYYFTKEFGKEVAKNYENVYSTKLY